MIAPGVALAVALSLAGAQEGDEPPKATRTSTSARSISDAQRREESDREAALFGSPAPPTETATPARGFSDAQREAASALEASLSEEPGRTTQTGTSTRSISQTQRDEESAREAAIFGDPTRPGQTARSAAPRSPAALGERKSSRLLDSLTDRLSSELEARDDIVDIGGQLLLQAQLGFIEDRNFEDATVRSPNFLDVYLDARPNERIRLFAQGRVQTDFTFRDDAAAADGGAFAFQGVAGFQTEQTQALLDQLWLKFDVARTLYVTAGKQRVRWGSGRVFNPTDFLNRQRLNPVAIFDQRLGLGLLRLHLPVESLGWNFYAVADLEDADEVGQVGGLVRGEFLVEQAELAVTLASQADQGERIGLDLSAGVWRFELRSELAFTTGSNEPFFEGEFDLGNLVFPTAVDRSERWLVEAMVGFDVTFRLSDDGDQLILGAEYYYNEGGYAESDLVPYFGFSAAAAGTLQGLGPLVGLLPDAQQDVLDAAVAGAQVSLNPFRFGRHYLAAFATLLGPGSLDDTTLLLTGISNLSDRTALFRLDLSQTVLTYLGVRVFTQIYAGDAGGIFKLEVPPLVEPGDPAAPFVGAVPGLDALLTQGIRAPLFDVGFAFTLSF